LRTFSSPRLHDLGAFILMGWLGERQPQMASAL
jgi:hypothetical protein